MKNNGKIAHDAQMVATLRRCADARDAIAGTLAAIHECLKPPVFVTPKEVLEDGTLIYPAPGETPAEAIDAVVANPPMNAAQQKKGGPDGKSE